LYLNLSVLCFRSKVQFFFDIFYISSYLAKSCSRAKISMIPHAICTTFILYDNMRYANREIIQNESHKWRLFAKSFPSVDKSAIKEGQSSTRRSMLRLSPRKSTASHALFVQRGIQVHLVGSKLRDQNFGGFTKRFRCVTGERIVELSEITSRNYDFHSTSFPTSRQTGLGFAISDE